jgi:hemerythrin
MAMTIEWTAALATGVVEIDKQHQELFRRINELLDACHKGKGPEAVGEVLAYLDNYARLHFATEENYMVKYGFADYQTHREQHREFMTNVAEVRRRFTEEGPGVHIVVITNRVIAGWLNTHIRRSDKALGAYIKAYQEAH